MSKTTLNLGASTPILLLSIAEQAFLKGGMVITCEEKRPKIRR